MKERIVCVKCGREKAETEFFKLKTGNRDNMCKSCLTMHIDNRKPETFQWILEKFDVPYIEKVWIQQVNKIYAKNPSKFGPSSVIGQYIRIMNMKQYEDYHYADSERLNFEDQKHQLAAQSKREELESEEELRAMLERGEITQAEYQTRSFTTPSSDVNVSANFIQDAAIDESAIQAQLTEEDIQYLTNQWGLMYRPSEWVFMEKMYQQYANDYELTVDRENILKMVCKVYLKMDQALDLGDSKQYKELAATYDQLRKSGKFTDAQNKEEQSRYLDSIGELVALVEREGGPIIEFVDPDEYPQDKIDFTIKDLKTYNRNLAVNELNLGDLIETYIQKLEQSEQESSDDLLNSFVLSEEDEASNMLTDDEAREFQEYLEEGIAEDAARLAEQFGD